MRTPVAVEGIQDSEGIIRSEASILTNNEEGILNIYYNNCNGLQPGELLKEKLKEKIQRNKKG